MLDNKIVTLFLKCYNLEFWSSIHGNETENIHCSEIPENIYLVWKISGEERKLM